MFFARLKGSVKKKDYTRVCRAGLKSRNIKLALYFSTLNFLSDNVTNCKMRYIQLVDITPLSGMIERFGEGNAGL